MGHCHQEYLLLQLLNHHTSHGMYILLMLIQIWVHQVRLLMLSKVTHVTPILESRSTLSRHCLRRYRTSVHQWPTVNIYDISFSFKKNKINRPMQRTFNLIKTNKIFTKVTLNIIIIKAKWYSKQNNIYLCEIGILIL